MGSGGTWVLLGLLVVVIIFVIVTTITGKKASKKEKAKRYQEVREKIKAYIAKTDNRKNLRVEFEKVYARKGAEYKYRDVFDVIVDLIEPKTQKHLETKAYEVEGITTKIDKKNYRTEWIVNTTLELEDTKKRIAIAEKDIKLTKEEKAALRREEREKEKEFYAKEKADNKAAKKASKSTSKLDRERELDRVNKQMVEKFVPVRRKD
ncbi:hypothetical protein [[Acholeplasma] multilocale]|uniref:hypothetical protein n=1 Tax=[Acholeplasma] multilocale TaxID=264638 RepID=UPI00047B0B6E|nr:hypothetical protein [[Acholeplasma] multilocale]